MEFIDTLVPILAIFCISLGAMIGRDDGQELERSKICKYTYEKLDDYEKCLEKPFYLEEK